MLKAHDSVLWKITKHDSRYRGVDVRELSPQILIRVRAPCDIVGKIEKTLNSCLHKNCAVKIKQLMIISLF